VVGTSRVGTVEGRLQPDAAEQDAQLARKEAERAEQLAGAAERRAEQADERAQGRCRARRSRQAAELEQGRAQAGLDAEQRLRAQPEKDLAATATPITMGNCGPWLTLGEDAPSPCN
jgi:hypothetical protein